MKKSKKVEMGFLTADEIFKDKSKKKYKCCFCGNMCDGWGNNPAPLKEDGKNRCCDLCNKDIVVPVRVILMKKLGRW